MAANDRQVGGTHYGLTARQHWDVVVEFDLDYFQGQITKYLFRWRRKGGVADLEKAQHYLEKYIEVNKVAANQVAERRGFGTAAPRVLKGDQELEQTDSGQWKCARCGEQVVANDSASAFAIHGSCAGSGYVNQD